MPEETGTRAATAEEIQLAIKTGRPSRINTRQAKRHEILEATK